MSSFSGSIKYIEFSSLYILSCICVNLVIGNKPSFEVDQKVDSLSGFHLLLIKCTYLHVENNWAFYLILFQSLFFKFFLIPTLDDKIMYGLPSFISESVLVKCKGHIEIEWFPRT